MHRVDDPIIGIKRLVDAPHAGRTLSSVRHVVKCPGCGEHVVYHAPVFGPAIETTPTVTGEFRISAIYTRHFGVRRTYSVVLHECGDDDGDTGDGDPVPAWPPPRPPSRIQSAQRDLDDD